MHIQEIVDSVTHHIPDGITTFAGIAVLAVIVLGVATAISAIISRIRRRKKDQTSEGVHRVGIMQRILTYLTVAVGLGYDFQGNWVAFSKMQMATELRYVLFGFLPLLLITCAVQGRNNYISTPEGEKPSLGVEGRAMWGIAIASALVSASAAADTTEAVARIVLPVLAAWRLKRLIVGEYAQAHGVDVSKVTGWFDRQWQRIQVALVRVGWMSAENTSLEEEDRSRRMGKLAAVAYRMHSLPAGAEKNKAITKWTDMVNKPKYSRLLRDLTFIAEWQMQLSGMYESVDESSREAVKKANPFTASGEEANIQRARRMLDRAPSASSKPKAPAPKRTTTATTVGSSGDDGAARTRILEFVRSYVAENGEVPSLRKCDAAADTNGYAKRVRPGILAQLGIEAPEREDEAS